MAAFSLAVAVALWREERVASAAVALAAAVYFALRVAGALGRRRGDHDDEP